MDPRKGKGRRENSSNKLVVGYIVTKLLWKMIIYYNCICPGKLEMNLELLLWKGFFSLLTY